MEIFIMTQIFYPKLDFTDSDQLNEAQMLVVTWALTLKALSSSEANIIILESSIISIYHNIDQVSKNLSSVSSHINIILISIASTNLLYNNCYQGTTSSSYLCYNFIIYQISEQKNLNTLQLKILSILQTMSIITSPLVTTKKILYAKCWMYTTLQSPTLILDSY
jgi:hypothetical protein